VADRAETPDWNYRDFVALQLAEEVAHRKQMRLQRLTRKARFPFFKTIDEFDFGLQTTLCQSLLGSYLGSDFVTEGHSLILYGKAGSGKTVLAVAIGYRAIQNGFETLCTTAAELVEELRPPRREGAYTSARIRASVLSCSHSKVYTGSMNGREDKNSFVRSDFLGYTPTQDFDIILFRESMDHVP